MTTGIVPLNMGDIVTLKKGHPCGANEWEITRLGADIGLACRGCGRKIMLPRADFEKRYRGHLESGAIVDKRQ